MKSSRQFTLKVRSKVNSTNYCHFKRKSKHETTQFPSNFTPFINRILLSFVGVHRISFVFVIFYWTFNVWSLCFNWLHKTQPDCYVDTHNWNTFSIKRQTITSPQVQNTLCYFKRNESNTKRKWFTKVKSKEKQRQINEEKKPKQAHDSTKNWTNFRLQFTAHEQNQDKSNASQTNDVSSLSSAMYSQWKSSCVFLSYLLRRSSNILG